MGVIGGCLYELWEVYAVWGSYGVIGVVYMSFGKCMGTLAYGDHMYEVWERYGDPCTHPTA